VCLWWGSSLGDHYYSALHCQISFKTFITDYIIITVIEVEIEKLILMSEFLNFWFVVMKYIFFYSNIYV